MPFLVKTQMAAVLRSEEDGEVGEAGWGKHE
jgi:hypothetical protein